MGEIMNWMEKILVFLLLMLVLAVPLGIWGSIRAADNQQELIQQCLDDGKKKYECVSLLRRRR
jgi:formate hydrogenlyase subunit 4